MTASLLASALARVSGRSVLLLGLAGFAWAGCRLPAATAEPEVLFEIEVAVTVPNPCWTVRFREARRRADTLLAVSELGPPPAGLMCAQVVTVARDRVWVRVKPPAPGLRHLILDSAGAGRRQDAAPYAFVRSQSELADRLEGFDPVSRATPPSPR